MKLKKLLPLLLVLPLVACGKKQGEEKAPKGDLIIPDIDVASMQVNLPTKPTLNQGAIRSDETYDYIDLYEVSDFHGAVNFRESSEDAYLGLAKLSTYLTNQRTNNPGGTLILSSGDMFQGSAESNLTKGYMVNYAMQYMGFDAMAIGNHEFDWTDTWLRNNANLKYNTTSDPIPYLGANIYKKGTTELADFVKASTIVERNGYKIGVIGAMGDELEKSILASNVAAYDFVPYSKIVNDEAARLRSEEECNAVVLLAHEGLDTIKGVSGVDVIFGGHAHENKQIVSEGAAPMLATTNYGRGIAHVSLKFDKTSKECSYVSDSASIATFTNATASALADDIGIKAIMHEYEDAVNQIKNIKLGTTDVDLKYNEVLKNICTETVFESAKAALAETGNTEIEPNSIIAAFHNVNGGIRDDIKAGEITYGSVYSPFPFDNEVVLLKFKGQLLQRSLCNINNLGCYRTFQTRNDIDPNKYYYIATTDFVALSTSDSGINGRLKTITEDELIHTGKIVRDEIAKKIYKLDKVNSSAYSNTKDCFKAIPMNF